MAEIIQEEKQEGGKKKPKHHGTHIDMTPMVDLMCLLITFFMLTLAFSKPKIMEIVLPEKIKDPKKEHNQPQVAKSRTVNLILGPDDKIYWYPGSADKPETAPPLQVADFSGGPTGIRSMLLERNRALFKKIQQFNDDILTGKIKIPHDSVEVERGRIKREDDTGPIVLIKAYKKANYGNFVDILDEMSIIGIARYTFMDINWVEERMIEEKLGIAPTTPARPTTHR
ncbi:MAG TPA: biopolymer transporter ExbD [Bacteroidales bacterium]|nr:biopolymer transporter ExbD [Bacteroidales bacterium]